MKKLTDPLRVGALRRVIMAYGINALGTWLGEIALAVLVLRQTHSAAAVAAVFVVGQFIPSLVTPALVTRVEAIGAKRSLPALLAAEAALFAVLAGVSSGASLLLVLVLIALDGALGLAARALLKASMVATTSPLGLMREGNALLAGVFTVCMAVGPCVAGVVVATLSPQAALLVDAASFALAALAIGVRANLPAPCVDQARVGERLREAIAHVRERPALRRLLSGYALAGVFSAAILPVEVVLVTDTLHASGAAYGTVLSLWGLGAIGGSALVPRLRDRPLSLLVAVSIAIAAVSYLGMGLAPSLIVVCVFSFLGGTGNGVEAFAAMTVIQEQTADAYQTRVSGLVEALVAATTGVGFLLGGVIASATSARAVYIVAGLGIFAVALTIFRIPRRAQAAYA
jgi:MFS family permease